MLADTLALPLDRARALLFKNALEVRVLRDVLLTKRRRIPALLVLQASFALALSVLAPTLLLIAGPLLLGVPHLLSDVRYLVLRPSLSNAVRRALLGGCGALIALRIAHQLGFVQALGIEPLLGAGFVLAATLAARRGAARGRVLLALGAVLGLGVAAWLWPRTAQLALAHGHNLVALGLWAFGFARRRGAARAISAALIGVAALLLLTPVSWWGFQHGLVQAFGLHSFAAATTLAPFATSAPLALGVVSSFAFLQSMHYAVWLHAVPQEETRGEASLSFRMTLRALRGDLGKLGAALGLGLAVLLPLSALASSATASKDFYLSLSAFHAYLELAAAVVFFVRAETPSTRAG
jgi:hypothetical protein